MPSLDSTSKPVGPQHNGARCDLNADEAVNFYLIENSDMLEVRSVVRCVNGITGTNSQTTKTIISP